MYATDFIDLNLGRFFSLYLRVWRASGDRAEPSRARVEPSRAHLWLASGSACHRKSLTSRASQDLGSARLRFLARGSARSARCQPCASDIILKKLTKDIDNMICIETLEKEMIILKLITTIENYNNLYIHLSFIIIFII